jgi:rod shape-determining protein MreB
MFNKLYRKFSNDIGIDLGTANTLVYLREQGIVINEPSVVVVNTKTGQIVAVGAAAKQMLGRTPAHIRAVQPVVDGVISDFEVTEEMLTYLIQKTEKISKKFFRPRVVVGVPTAITNVETRAVYDAAMSGGAGEVYIIEEPMAAAIGVRLPVKDAIGSIVIDIGGGTTDIAVIALGGVVRSKNLKVAGDKLNEDIVTYMRDEYKLLVGEKTAEMVKINLGSAIQIEKIECPIRGRDLVSGLPREIIVNDTDIRRAIMQSLISIVEATKEVLETTPPELLSDVIHRGIILTGGGALVRGIDTLISNAVKIPVYIADDPLTAVARGTGIVLDDLDYYKEVLVTPQNGLPPR